MDKLFAYIFLIIFLGMLIISSLVIKEVNISKFFKQGKVGSIRAAYFIIIIMTSGIVALTFTILFKMCYIILN